MRVGTGTRCITPQEPLTLAGYASDRTFREVHDDLYVKCLSVSSTQGRGLFITADLIGFGRGLVNEVKAELGAEHGLLADCILMTASHTHSGPAVLENMAANWPVDSAYMDWLKGRILAAAAEALKASEPCRLVLGTALCHVAVNRRRKVEGEWLAMPNESGPRDDEVIVIQMLREDESPEAVLLNYACHQTTVNLPAVSGDFAGHAQRVIESQLPGVMALYLQGCEGDVRPRTVKGDHFRPGTWADVERFGGELATAVLEACREPTVPIDAEKVSGRILEARLPFSDLPTEEEQRRAASADESLKQHHTRSESTMVGRMERAWGLKLQREGFPPRPYAPFRIQRLSLGEATHFVGLEGEVCVEYGSKLKEMGRQRSQVFIPVGIADGLLQYIPTAQIRQEGGYASSIPFKGWGLAGPFAPELEEEIWCTIGKLWA